MSITGISIKRPILVIVFFLVITMLGWFGYQQLNYELLPKIETPYITIGAIYPGASPQEVENSVTKIIEEALADLNNVKRTNAYSSESVSFNIIEYNYGTNLDDAAQDAQRAVEKILSQLPTAVKKPTVSKFSLGKLPILRLAITSNTSNAALYNLIKDDVKPRIAQVKGVAQVDLFGGEPREVRIEMQPDKLITHQLSPLLITDAVSKTNLDIPLGNMKQSAQQMPVSVQSKATNVQQLQSMIVQQYPNGAQVKLGDVAVVKDTTAEKENYVRLNQIAGLGITIQKQSNANTVQIIEQVKTVLSDIEKEQSAIGLKISIAHDDSEFTLHAADTVKKDILIAIALVALVMLIFLHSLRNALIVIVSIPASLISVFLFMYWFGFSLNLMTLLAMSLVIGILVDDSIVVLENIYHHLERGSAPKQAALEGRNEIGFAALSITLVDVVVFLPMAFVPGLVGSILKEFSLVIVASTLMSLLVSFTLTPMLASRFSKLQNLNSRSLMARFSNWFENIFRSIIRSYSNSLQKALHYPKTIILSCLILLLASFTLVMYDFIGSEFIPATDKGEIQVALEMPSSTTLNEMNKVAQYMEKRIGEMKEVKRIFTNVGSSNEGFILVNGSNVAELSVQLIERKKRTFTVQQMSDRIRQLANEVPGLKLNANAVGIFGTGNDAPIQINLSGVERENVLAAGNQLLELTKTVQGIKDARLSAIDETLEMEVSLNKEKLAWYGLTVEQVGMAMRIIFTGYDELKMRDKGKEINMRIVYDEKNKNTYNRFQQFFFTNASGLPVYFPQIATVHFVSKASNLERRNKNSSISVYANVSGRASGEVGEDIKTKINSTQWPSGIRFSYEGDMEMQSDSFTKLFYAFIAAIVFVYFIMSALYNSFITPFIVMFSVPVAIVGALLALALMRQSINIFTLFGMIMTVGLVAKNAILLVDRANKAREEGKNINDALIDAGSNRLRPIVMTTIAMVVGMLPIALGTGAAAEMYSGLGWVLVGGLSSSMFLTLFLVPAVYKMVYRVLDKIKSWSSSFTKKSATVVALLLLGFGVNNLQAQNNPQPLQLTLQQAIDYAQKNNAGLKALAYNQQIASEKVKQAASYQLPQVSADANFVYNIKQPVFFLENIVADPTTGDIKFEAPFRPVNSAAKFVFQGVIMANWNFFQPEVVYTKRAAKLNQQSEQLSYQYEEQRIKNAVTKMYWTYQLALAQQQLVDSNVSRLERNLLYVRDLNNHGMLAANDTLQAYTEYVVFTPEITKAQNDIQQVAWQLKQLLGLPLDAAIELTDKLDSKKAEPIQDSSLDLNNRFDIRSLQLQIQSAEQLIKSAKSKSLPTFSLFAQWQKQSQFNNFNTDLKAAEWPVNYFVGVKMSIPLFTGFYNKSAAREADLKWKQATQQKQWNLQQANLEVNILEQKKRSSYEKIWITKKAMEAGRKNYKAAETRWRQGLIKQADISLANLTVKQAETNFLIAIYEYLTNTADLEFAKGQ